MHWLSCVFILVTLHLQYIKSLPAALKHRQQDGQMMDWNDVIKLDFSPHGIKKELNLDMGLFAVRSKQTLKFGEEVEEEEEDKSERRKKRAVNVVPEAAPCYTMQGGTGSAGGGTVDYDDVAERRRSQKKSKVAAKARSMLNKLKKKKKLVSEGMPESLLRSRRDVQDLTDKVDELKNRFMNFINKVRKFSEDLIDRIKH